MQWEVKHSDTTNLSGRGTEGESEWIRPTDRRKNIIQGCKRHLLKKLAQYAALIGSTN